MAITSATVTSGDISEGEIFLSGLYSWSGASKNDFTVHVIIDGNPVELGVFTWSGNGGFGSEQWSLTVLAPDGMEPGTTYSFTITDGSDNVFAESDFTVTCFYPGTLIATAQGEKPVEELQIGDLVATADGRFFPVRWVGQQVVSRLFTDELRALPIRIKAGALDGNVPKRDLLVTPAHALFIRGVLVNAGALVNGTTIIREYDVPQVITYYHVELEEHALLLAEGTPAESFVDRVDRGVFTNWNEYQALNGREEPIPEMAYPRAKSRRQVPAAVRQQIEARTRVLVPVANVG